MDFWSSLQGWQASTFGLWRATWLGTFMQIPGQRHTWQEPVFFSPGARPSFYGRLNGECYDHGVVENSISQWRNAVVGQSSRSRKHSSRPNLSEPWFFLGTGGTLLRPIRQCGVDFGSWFCAGPSQSRETWLAPWQHWGMWLQRWKLLCHKQWQIWRVHLYLIVDQQYRFHPVDLGIYLLKWGENWETP